MKKEPQHKRENDGPAEPRKEILISKRVIRAGIDVATVGLMLSHDDETATSWVTVVIVGLLKAVRAIL